MSNIKCVDKFGKAEEDIVQEPEARLKQLISNSAVHVDADIPIRRYYRSGQELLRMAITYHEEGSQENAYTLYHKYMVLFLQEISKHPEYSTYPIEIKKRNKKRCMSLLEVAEKLKKQLFERYQAEYEKFVTQQVLVEQELDKRRQQELEERRRLIEEEEARTLGHEDAKSRRLDHEDDEARRSRWQEEDSEEGHRHSPPPPAYHDVVWSTNEDDDNSRCSSAALYPSQSLDLPSAPQQQDFPALPSSDTTTSSRIAVPQLPSRALKPVSGSSSGSNSVPSIDRSSKPTSLLGGGGASLRRVRLPQKMVDQFMLLAATNTARNIETCGVLAGIMRKGELHVTHLLIPKQSGTPDSCTTQHEEQLFAVQDKHDIITLGWIHTHPTQTAFLSSVDLHTHCSYQLMMPEAVAVVCAPKHKETAVFTLTPDHGLNYIAQCKQTGFHPHPAHPPLFVKAAHAVLENNADIEVIDLR
uniref:STAM-binding protein-like A n=2 Tax=Hirondellea gigas TaxID=1518452 RepID=A0A6A7FZ57_9CRUS